MARIRTVKPVFFRHELLQDLEAERPDLRPMLVFAALWGHCDKAGAFVWKPRQLKLDILPFLPFDMADTLALLVEHGLIRKYTVAGKEYGLVPSFTEHQSLAGKEASGPATYPQPEAGSDGEEKGTLEGKEEGKGKERAKTFPVWVDALDGAEAIPADHPVFAYADKVGIPRDFLALAWLWFEKTYGAGGRSAAKKYIDWPTHFRNAVEGNWPKAWYFTDSGECRLTTTGQQLQRELA